LKELLTSAPILKVADPDEDFVVCVDAHKEGLGGVLTQNRDVLYYESRKLKEHEKNHATHDLELTTIVHALKMWSNYLMGIKFELRTDNSGLKYLFKQTTLNARKTRWLEFLSEHDFDIKHIKGKENKGVDILIRMVHEMHATSTSMYYSDSESRILDAVTSDQHYAQVKEVIQRRNVPLKLKDYMMGEDGVLLFNDEVYVPNS
jgi:hypothetical protein